MDLPKFDSRTSQDVLEQIYKLAKAYAPDWNIDAQNPDVGMVAAQLFADMFAGTLYRSQRRLYNHHLMFLNLLGAKQLPPLSASGMVTVAARRNFGGTYIPKGTPLYASADNAEGRVYFETTEAMYAADTDIQSIHVTERDSNQIQRVFLRTADEESVGAVQLFGDASAENLQQHIMYLEDDMVLQTKDSTELVIQFSNVLSAQNHERVPRFFQNGAYASWQFWNGEAWTKIEEVEPYGNGIRLRFAGTSEPCEVMGKTARFVRFALQYIPKEPILFSDLQYGSQALAKQPDILLFNSEELPTEDFFPFGEQFVVYTDFYIGSQEVLYKKGARIDLSVELDFQRVKTDVIVKKPEMRYKFLMRKADFEDQKPTDIEIDRVVWEYWNGVGWARLFADASYEDFFTMQKNDMETRTLSFCCPEDIEMLVMGPEKNYFIRARLLKVRNPYEVMGDYIAPRVHKISMSYSYVGNYRSCRELRIESDMMEYAQSLPMSGDQPLFQSTLCAHPAVFLELRQPLQDGPIRLFFDVLPNTMHQMPALRWEYFGRHHSHEGEWRNLEIMDGTENFAHSGIVTIVGCRGFTETTLFGRTGYFLRIVNLDGQYRGLDAAAPHPNVQSISYNTVQIVQRDTRQPEYFMMQRQEAHKECRLSVGNLEQVTVWVNELGHLSMQEQEQLLKKTEHDVRPVYLEDGRLDAIWVKWRELEDIRRAQLDERVYEVDYMQGIVKFGDSKHGAIPPAQHGESISIAFSVSAGALGNLEAHAMGGFFGAVDGVDAVINEKPLLGGVQMEKVDATVRRMTAQLSGMGAMVTQDDFEEILRCAEQNIYRVRCIPHRNRRYESEIGNLAVAILPTDYMQGYEKFSVLAKRVRQYLAQRAPISLHKIEVFEVSYLEISVVADLVIREYDRYHEVYRNVTEHLKRFLNPVCGNFNKQGWEIGTLPTREQVYNYIKTTDGVQWVKSVNLFTSMVTEHGRQDVAAENLPQYAFMVPVFGEPEINLSVE